MCALGAGVAGAAGVGLRFGWVVAVGVAGVWGLGVGFGLVVELVGRCVGCGVGWLAVGWRCAAVVFALFFFVAVLPMKADLN